MAQPFSWEYRWVSTEMMILHDAGIGQGEFGAADSPNHQLTVLREAGSDMMILQDAGRDQLVVYSKVSPTLRSSLPGRQAKNQMTG